MSTLEKFDPDMSIRNKNYETDLKYDLELNRILLKSIGVWPTDSRHLTNFDRIITVLTKLLTFFFLLFLMIPIGCYVLFVEAEWSIKIQQLITFNYCFEATVKYAIVIARNEDIKSCIDMIASDWREIEWPVSRSIMLKNARFCRIFTAFLIITNCSIIIIYHLIVPFVSERFDALQPNGTKLGPIIYLSEFIIFDAQVSPMCEIVYVGQTLGGICMDAVNCGICTIAVKLVMHACNRYQIVIALLQSIDDVENNDANDIKCQDEKERRFVHIIRQHLHAIEFVPRIENALNGICFVTLAASTINMCFTGYVLILEWEKGATDNVPTYTLAMMTFISNILVLCYSGEHLAEQCRRVGMAGYMTDWWGMQLTQSRALILIIAVTQKPVEFTAGKIFDLSLKTFGAVIRIAMTYLNVLRTMIQLDQ